MKQFAGMNLLNLNVNKCAKSLFSSAEEVRKCFGRETSLQLKKTNKSRLILEILVRFNLECCPMGQIIRERVGERMLKWMLLLYWIWG